MTTTRKEEIAAILERLKEKEKKKKKKTFKLESYDGKVNRVLYQSKTFEVDKLCVLESDAIRVLFLKFGFGESSTYINSNILQQTLEFCKLRAEIKVKYFLHDDENLLQDRLNDFDSKFLKKIASSKRLIMDFLRAACRLKIKSLLDLTSTAIVNIVSEKNTHEILKMFRLKENITVQEIEDKFKAFPWAFK